MQVIMKYGKQVNKILSYQVSLQVKYNANDFSEAKLSISTLKLIARKINQSLGRLIINRSKPKLSY